MIALDCRVLYRRTECLEWLDLSALPACSTSQPDRVTIATTGTRYLPSSLLCRPRLTLACFSPRAASDTGRPSIPTGGSQAVAVLFHLGPKPEVLGDALVRRMATDTLSSDLASPMALARLCFVLGHLAIKMLVYIEVKASGLGVESAPGDGGAVSVSLAGSKVLW